MTLTNLRIVFWLGAATLAAAGCGNNLPANGDLASGSDGGAKPDLASVADLSTGGGDAAVNVDLAGDDLAGTADLSVPVMQDLAGGGDGALSGSDLSVPSDLTPPDDLTPPSDLTPPCPDNTGCVTLAQNTPGLCKMGVCSTCTDVSDDGACNSIYGSMNSPFICLTGACVPGNCRVDGDCGAGLICGAITPNLCGKCTIDGQCQADPGYGANFICATGPGTCVANACAVANDVACPLNGGDVCCSMKCIPGGCCDSTFCHNTKGNNFTCLDNVCTQCDAVGGLTFLVDPVNGSDASGTGSAKAGGVAAPACAFATISRALQVIGPNPTPGTIIQVLGNSTVGPGEHFPIIVPAKTAITGTNTVTVKVPANSSGFILNALGATLNTLTIDGQTNTAVSGVLSGKGCDVTCALNGVTVQNMGKDGIELNAGALTIGAGTTVTNSGTVMDSHSGLHVTGTGHVVINNPAMSPPIVFTKNSAHGILVDLSAWVTITGVPGVNGAGSVVASANQEAGIWIEQTPMPGGVAAPPINSLTGFVSWGQVNGNGIRIVAGSSAKLRGCVSLNNSGSGVIVSSYIHAKAVSNDMTNINLGKAMDPGLNTFQATQGMSQNSGSGICLAVAANSGVLAAEGNTFAGPTDCSKVAAKLVTNVKCGGHADIGGALAGSTVDTLMCTNM